MSAGPLPLAAEAVHYVFAQARTRARVRAPEDLDAHEERIELYRRRVARGLEPCSGLRPTAPAAGRSTAWLDGELAALEAFDRELAAADEEARRARAAWR